MMLMLKFYPVMQPRAVHNNADFLCSSKWHKRSRISITHAFTVIVKSSQVKFIFSIAEQSILLNYTTQNYTVKYIQLHTTSLYNKVYD